MPVLEEGQIFERYRIIKWLANGSAGESYEAEDTMLLRKITLKLIHPWTTLPDSARRQFFREMQAVSTLNQRYLAPLLDYGEIDGRIYVARRYVSSGSLLGTNGRLWFRPPLPIGDAFKYTNQLAQALYYIHQRGYTHGSLTFSNVLVLRGPNVENEKDYAPFLLADVGLASFVRRFGKPGIEALPVGAAPEQLGKRVTAASDQFALAVLLYFWLAGRPPYVGTPEEVEHLKRSETVIPLSKVNTAVTPEQDGIILRALAVQPEQRYPTVLAFAEALLASLSSPARSQPKPIADLPRPPETPREFLSTSLATSRDEVPRTVPLSGDSGSGEQDNAPAASVVPEEPEVQSTPIATESSQVLPEIPVTPQVEAKSIEAVEGVEEAVTAEPLVSVPETPEAETVVSEVLTVTEDQQEKPGEAGLSSSVGEVITEAAPSEVSEQTLVELSKPLVANEEAGSPLPQTPASADSKTEETSENAAFSTEQAALLPRLIVSPPYSSNSYEFLLSGEETNIGRAGASDLLLDQDNLTSRHHALIKRVDERVLLFDKRSNNGVFVNGQQIEAELGYELADGDHISIGSYELIFRVAPAGSALHGRSTNE